MSDLRIYKLGNRFEIVRETQGISRRIGVVNEEDDARLFMRAPDLLSCLQSLHAECGDPWVHNDGFSPIAKLLADVEGDR